MNIKKVIKIILVILWMVVIFNFSAQNSTESLDTSNKVIVDTAEVIKNRPLSTEEKITLIDKYKVIVRKFAHFFLYFILAIIVYFCLRDYYPLNIKIVIFTVLICAIYACSDEVHQLFISGRTARFFDIFIDSCGALLSTLLLFTIDNLIKNKIKKV